MLADLWCPCLSSQPVGILYISPQHLYSLKWKLKCGRRQKRRASRFDRKQVRLPQEDYYWYFDKYIGEHLAARINVTPSVSVGTLTVHLETPSVSVGALTAYLETPGNNGWCDSLSNCWYFDSTLGDTDKCNSLRIDGALDSIFGDTQQQRLM